MPYVPHHLYFVPAGMEVWGYSADMRFVKDAVLTFDLARVGERLEHTLGRDLGATPRLRFADDRLWTLIKLLSDVVDDRDLSSQLYGDGLTAAILARLTSQPKPPDRHESGLAPWQLRRVREYLDTHLSQRVELATLATLVGLSQSHFSHAFKASTGVAPFAGSSTRGSVAHSACCSRHEGRSSRWRRRRALRTRCTSGERSVG